MCYKRCILIVLSSIFFIFISCSSSSEYPVSITTENGIKTVINPDYPKYPTDVELEEVLSIGEADGDINNTFYRLRDVNVDGQGVIYTVDIFDRIIRVFDNTGEFRNTIGKTGQGPGEFVEPGRLFIDSKDIVYLHDTKNSSRVTRYFSDGKYINDFKIALYGLLIGLDNEDNLYTTNRLSWDGRTRIEERSFERLDVKGNVINTITTLEGQNGTAVPRGAWKSGYEHGSINYAIKNNGDLIVGKSDTYMFSVFDNTGALTLKFGRDYDPISVSESDKSRVTNNPDHKKLIAPTKPAFKMSYYRFLVDDENNFWVMTFEREDEGITYDIFDEDGIYVRKVFIEFRHTVFKPRIIKNGLLYAIHIDEEGINRVKAYKLHYRN